MEKQIFRSYIVWPIDVVVLYNNRTNSFRKREIVIRIRYPRTGVPDVFFRFYFRIAFDDVRRGVLLDDLHIQQCVRARRCNYYVFCIAFCIDWNAVKTRRRICSNENSKYRRGTTPRRSSFIGRACYVRLFFRSIPEIHAAVSNYRNEQNKKNRYLRKRSNVSPNEFYWRVQSFSKYRTLFEFFFFWIVHVRRETYNTQTRRPLYRVLAWLVNETYVNHCRSANIYGRRPKHYNWSASMQKGPFKKHGRDIFGEIAL